MTRDIEDYYAYLGVSPKATTEEINAAFKSKMKAVHPDVDATDEADRERRHVAAVRLNGIVEILRDPKRRAAYDRDLAYAVRHRNDPEPTGRHDGVDPGSHDKPPPASRTRTHRASAKEGPGAPPRFWWEDRDLWHESMRSGTKPWETWERRQRGEEQEGPRRRSPIAKPRKRSVKAAAAAMQKTRRASGVVPLFAAVLEWLLASAPGQWLVLGALFLATGLSFVVYGGLWLLVVGLYTRTWPLPVTQIAWGTRLVLESPTRRRPW